MAIFTGTIQLAGDPERLPAVISVDEGRINISSRSQPIGDWTLRDAGFRHVPAGIEMSVDGERLLLEVDNPDSLARAVGLRPASEQRRRVDLTQPHPAQVEPRPERESKSAEEMARELADELDPYVSEVKEGLSRIRLSRNAWIGVGVAVVLAILLPNVSVPLLSIVGTLGVVAGGAAMFEPSVESRLPEWITPVQLLAAGAAAFVLAMVILLIR